MDVIKAYRAAAQNEPFRYHDAIKGAIEYTNRNLAAMEQQYRAQWTNLHNVLEPLYLDVEELRAGDNEEYTTLSSTFMANPSEDFIKELWNIGHELSQPWHRAVATNLALKHKIGLGFISEANPGFAVVRGIISEVAKASPAPPPYPEVFYTTLDVMRESMNYNVVFSPILDTPPPGGVFRNSM